jgi:amino acid permease
MNTDRIVALAPHYVAMLVIVFLVLNLVRVAVGEIGFWVELVVVVAIVFAYRPLVVRLGIGPDEWE